jgi:hypothetical protein
MAATPACIRRSAIRQCTGLSYSIHGRASGIKCKAALAQERFQELVVSTAQKLCKKVFVNSG